MPGLELPDKFAVEAVFPERGNEWIDGTIRTIETDGIDHESV